jgi:hypothetical protein
MSPYEKLEAIYNKHRRKYKVSRDYKKMCCMWSTFNPPDFIEGTAPFQDIEKAFGITIQDEDAFEMYDMNLEDALKLIEKIQKRSKN